MVEIFNNSELTAIRDDFPILHQTVNEEPLIYLDNAASNHKPKQVLQAMLDFYQNDYANIHRGVHSLAERATRAYEASRLKVAQFIQSPSAEEIIFTSSTTAGLNFLASQLIAPQLTKGDVILTTRLEHHSNLVVWQEICRNHQAELQFLELNQDYIVDLDKLNQYNDVPIKALVIHHVSNVLGVSQPLKALADWVHQRGGVIIVDGAQAPAHSVINVADLGVDAYCFSGHKLYGPTGIGVCYLRQALQERCLPFFYGGEMIYRVDDLHSTFKTGPWKFEGGTPPIAQAIGLAAAIDYVNHIGLNNIQAHEAALTQLLHEHLQQIPGIQIYSKPHTAHGLICFNIEGVHPHDAATGYDMEGIALRAGHHCAQPLMRLLDTAATLRASLAVYNTPAEVIQFIATTIKVKEFFVHGGLI